MFCLIFQFCDPLVNKFEDTEDAQMYKAKSIQNIPTSAENLTFMTWNIRFGVGRLDWFGDCCGNKVIVGKHDVYANLEKVAELIEETQPDIIFLQEVDVESKRTGYIDQVQWLLNNTYFNYGSYASMWEAQFVPSDGLGRINTGTAILSRWKITDATRIQLPLREDQDALTKYFYLRRNLLKTKIEIPGFDDFWGLCLHLSAFSTDDTKERQLQRVFSELEDLEDATFVIGGDYNLLPPGADSLDYCDEDKCEDESFHKAGDDPQHKEGSYYVEEWDWLQPLYDRYHPAVPLAEYLADEKSYFTHTTKWDKGFWDRKLDYIFSNLTWIAGSDSTYQDACFDRDLSDHVAVSVKWEVTQ